MDLNLKEQKKNNLLLKLTNLDRNKNLKEKENFDLKKTIYEGENEIDNLNIDLQKKENEFSENLKYYESQLKERENIEANSQKVKDQINTVENYLNKITQNNQKVNFQFFYFI